MAKGIRVRFLMAEIYEIFADEAWTHSSKPLNRYWCFFGGIFGKQSDLDRLDTQLRRIIADHSHKGEIKWSSLTPRNLPVYQELTDALFLGVRSGGVKYRQMFLDRSYVWRPRHHETDSSELTGQFKLYYQFLKHAFGIQHIPRSETRDTSILVRLDRHSSQQHTLKLQQFAGSLPDILERPDLTVSVTFRDSRRVPRLQIADVLMGAAGSYGNKMHLLRLGERRGMSEKQRIRLGLCKHIYNNLRAIVEEDREMSAFNWFETTGRDGNWENAFHHKVRIWKFKPRHHVIDRGWHNDHLDRQGRYQGPVISPT